MIDAYRSLVRHPVAVGMLFAAAVVFGYVGYLRLPIELMPDIGYPTLTVRTVWEGAAPQELEAQVSRPVEEALATLDGLVSLESRSRADQSDVVLGFAWGTDMAESAQAVREQLQLTFLPDEAERPLVLRYDPSLDPFLRVALGRGESAASPERDLLLLRELAENELRRELEAVEGVAAVRIRGGLEREIRVLVREDWLVARGLGLDAVRTALGSENVNVAGGSILEGDVEYLIRTLNEYRSVDELRQLRLRRSDGVEIPLTDVAEVFEGHKDREVVSRLDGGEAVELEIFREADANVVAVADRVKKRLYGDGVPKQYGGTPGLKDGLPEGVTLALLDDQAEFIESAIDNLVSTALLGGLLAVAVLWLFLRDFRSTLVVGVAIPLSLVVGIAPLYLLGVTLNLMSLGGLALGVGMLVDNAVVVLESIGRYREQGLPSAEAAARGAAEVAVAVIASTMTTVAVFLPITFVEGVAGELFGDLSVAVVSSLMASLAVALLLVPVLAARDLSLGSVDGESLIGLVAGRRPVRERLALLWGRLVVGPWAEFRGDARGWRGLLLLPWWLLRLGLTLSGGLGLFSVLLVGALSGRLALGLGRQLWRPVQWAGLRSADLFQAVYLRFAAGYDRVLAAALLRPGGVLAAAGGSALLALLVAQGLGSELLPDLHQGRFVIELALPVGTPLERTVELAALAERRVRAHPDVERVYVAAGADRRADAAGDEGEHTARLRVQLRQGGDPAAREARAMDDLRRSLDELPRAEVKMSRPALFSFRTPIEVLLFDDRVEALEGLGRTVALTLEALPSLRDVRSSQQPGYPEIRIHYDRERLHRLGLDPAAAAASVRDRVQGVEATRLRRGDQRVAARVQLVEGDRSTLEDLGSLNINPALNPPVPLHAVATLEEAVGPSEIRRIDQQRAVVVGANLAGFDLGSAVSEIEGALVGLRLPEGTHWEVAGQSREMRTSMASMQLALLLAIFLVYVIMASTFEHLLHPLLILGSVPLAAVGAALVLALAGASLSVMVLIGGIVLAGVVVNNAIVLVDTIHRLEEEGYRGAEAVQAAAVLRLRPILITSATTVLGLMPLALGIGAGAELQGPLALTVIGGLTSSTLLTLLVIPVLYRLLFARGAADA